MSIVMTLCLSDGIIMAADRRLTHYDEYTDGRLNKSYEDNTDKIYGLTDKNIGISWCGDYKVGDLDIPDFIEYFKSIILPDDTISEIADKLNEECIGKYRSYIHWQIGGYINNEQYLYEIKADKVIRKNINPDTERPSICSILGGKMKTIKEFLDSDNPICINNKMYYSSRIPSMTIDDGILFSAALLMTTCEKEEGCGGDIDVLVVKQDKMYCTRINKNPS